MNLQKPGKIFKIVIWEKPHWEARYYYGRTLLAITIDPSVYFHFLEWYYDNARMVKVIKK